MDSYQGRENDVVLLSMSRSNQHGEIGFAKTMNRVNVGISRARFKMIIIASMDAFSRSGRFGRNSSQKS